MAHIKQKTFAGIIGPETLKNNTKGTVDILRHTLFEKLLNRQQILDQNIKQTKNLDFVSVQDKAIALEVELSEFANEVRFFKYWSNKGMSRDEALEEYIDGLHFFLSLANEMDISRLKYIEQVDTGMPLGKIYTLLKSKVLEIHTSTNPREIWHDAFCYFWIMGQTVGFTEAEIETAYNEKNATNHKRQGEGY